MVLRSYRPDLPFAGVILNRVASARHERLARLGMEAAGIPVLGALPRRGDLVLPERHLGLVQAVEHPDLEAAIVAYAAFLRAHVDIAAVRQAAGGAGPSRPGRLPPRPASGSPWRRMRRSPSPIRIVLAGWRAGGAEILPFSPLADEAPDPGADLCWLPGGYPELHAGRLPPQPGSAAGLRQFAETRPVHGECGGYMALGEALIDKEGVTHRMAGLLGLVTSFEKRRMHLGYRSAALLAPLPGFAAGARLRGHEFHYSTILDQPDAPLARVTDADRRRGG